MNDQSGVGILQCSNCDGPVSARLVDGDERLGCDCQHVDFGGLGSLSGLPRFVIGWEWRHQEDSQP